eukprot:TRINITY_DN330_c0_g1_i1.p1 TRINITY_DN330_c0_g1~~TRINITY_DN330_c0_g1_i1.p1  ORF type:complete len:596 (+),score=176.69 TRINITY_DN330_c0_g1_i1:186-1973(+)
MSRCNRVACLLGSGQMGAFFAVASLLFLASSSLPAAEFSGSLAWTVPNMQFVAGADAPFACSFGSKCTSCVVLAGAGDVDSETGSSFSAVDVATGTVAWTYEPPGDDLLSAANVVVVGGSNAASSLVCGAVTSCGNECAWSVVCVSAATGKMAWQTPKTKYDSSGWPATLLTPPGGSCAGSAPDASLLLVDVNVGRVSCVVNGVSVWNQSTGKDGSIISVVPLWQRVPAGFSGVGRTWLLLQTYSNYPPYKGSPSVWAIDVAAKGAMVWRQGSSVVPNAGLSTCQLVLLSTTTNAANATSIDDLLVIPEGYNKVLALWVGNGSVAWSVSSGGFHDDLVVQDGLVKGIDPIDGNNNRLRAWRASDGSLAWQYPDQSASTPADSNASLFIWTWGQAPAAASATIDTVQGAVFVQTSYWFALDSNSGKLLYKVPAPPASANLQVPPIAYLPTDPLGALDFFAANTGVAAYNATDGSLAWWSTRMMVTSGSAMLLSQVVPGLLYVGDSDVSFPAVIGVDGSSGAQDFTVSISAGAPAAQSGDTESWSVLPLAETVIASGDARSDAAPTAVALVAGAYTSGDPPYQTTQTFIYGVAVTQS